MDNQAQKTNLASPGLRLIGWFIDLMFWLLIVLFFVLLLVSQTQLEMLMDNILLTIVALFVLLPLLVPFVNSFLITTFGGSVGNILTQTRIVDKDGKNISYWKGFFRNYLGYMVSAMLFWLGFIWAFIDKERRTWHDMMADTWVVTRNKSGILIGSISLIGIIILNSILISNIYTKAYQNRMFYKDIVDEVIMEAKSLYNNEKLMEDMDFEANMQEVDVERNPFEPTDLF